MWTLVQGATIQQHTLSLALNLAPTAHPNSPQSPFDEALRIQTIKLWLEDRGKTPPDGWSGGRAWGRGPSLTPKAVPGLYAAGMLGLMW